jgi:adenylate cyclase
MKSAVPSLNTKWEGVLGFPLRIGIGLNTGPAHVGNAGSSQRMKYGPLGHAVNLASRVEGATKQFGVDVLVSEATQRQLSSSFITRRLCRVRVVGIQGDVAIYELHAAPGAADWLELREQYERSLEEFEAGTLDNAQQSLRTLLGDARFQHDRASRVLLENVKSAMQRTETEHSPIIELSSK